MFLQPGDPPPCPGRSSWDWHSRPSAPGRHQRGHPAVEDSPRVADQEDHLQLELRVLKEGSETFQTDPDSLDQSDGVESAGEAEELWEEAHGVWC